ncbi:class I SAM-dependent methyltransferase [Antarcticimicrobium luteum]|uniref:Class I SAM-dependent methyltransferase n=1 Tax=Antarcticimicrobium luteum TaxID=2547397 RepID=A0A4R5VC48_9RHOB|nr:class I SAM-dependent methyltransferase [Antarcticimicrobium luteum]TDK49878.1 class I SAM-dependent methyltransferase [Antarcticimicrobium luteum]
MPKPPLPDLEELIAGLDPARRRRLARTLVEQAAERERLAGFEAAGGLERPAYALSPGMAGFDIAPLIEGYRAHGDALARLTGPEGSASGYRGGNGYFDTPDAEALYLMIRRFAPRRVIEIGCGNSTRVTRQAIIDGGLSTELTAIDPWPRADIADAVDRFEQAALETVDPAQFAALRSGDVLFIDSSHQVRMSNDVAHLFCRIIPALAPGVVIHVHDVFLPYEYPARFFHDCPSWGEQYLLHALVQGGGYEILWPGYYLQRERADAVAALPFLGTGRAQSFWMRKR